MTKVRLLVMELVSAREAALGINLVTAERKTSFLRSIDTRVIAELHAGILPFLRDDEDLSVQLTTLRGQADVLNFRVQNVLPRFYQPKMIEQYADPNFDVFSESGLYSDSHFYVERLGRVIARLCEKAKLPVPKLLQGNELRDRGAF